VAQRLAVVMTLLLIFVSALYYAIANPYQHAVQASAPASSEPSLTLTAPGSWDLSVTPTADSSTLPVTTSTTITVTTNNPTGYNLSVKMKDEQTCLRQSTDYDPTDSSPNNSCSGIASDKKLDQLPTDSTPNASFPMNAWGLSLNAGSTWRAVPTSSASAGLSLKNTTQAATDSANSLAQTSLVLGAKVNYAKVSGTYRASLVFTAVPNLSTLPAPTITAISPSSGPVAGGAAVTATGTNFIVDGTVVVYNFQIGGLDCANLSISSATELTCTAPSHVAGSVDALVRSWGGTATLGDGYEYKVPPVPTSTWVKAANTNTAAIASVSGTSASSLTVDLDTNMIPIVNKASDGSYPSNWCDYDAKQWCNAVTVKPTGGTKTLAQYQSAAVGTAITESDILGYFTYIPRYQYQVQRFSPTNPPSCGPAATNNPGGVTGTCSTTLSSGLYGPRNFNIQFQKGSDPVLTPAKTGDWATHPAFEFTSGSTTHHLNGLWVGKFETTGSSGALTIKPNQTSLRDQTISLQYDQAKRIGAVDPAAESYGGSPYLNNAGVGAIPQNQHNLTTAKTHDFTNKDWGAVIYLATSTYGAGDTTYANGSNKNDHGVVGKNANSDYVTGCGRYDSHSDASSYAGTTTCKRTTDHDRSYFSIVGLESSTTSNVYGVYDMVGGAMEYTMSNYGSTNLSAGFSTLPAGSYINIYPSVTFTNNNDYANFNQCTYALCGGQGLYETTFADSVSSSRQSWSRDYSGFVYSSFPWAFRGGYYMYVYEAGLFVSNHYTGIASGSYGFRVGAGIF
jgi:hypothetical protein